MIISYFLFYGHYQRTFHFFFQCFPNIVIKMRIDIGIGNLLNAACEAITSCTVRYWLNVILREFIFDFRPS